MSMEMPKQPEHSNDREYNAEEAQKAFKQLTEDIAEDPSIKRSKSMHMQTRILISSGHLTDEQVEWLHREFDLAEITQGGKVTSRGARKADLEAYDKGGLGRRSGL